MIITSDFSDPQTEGGFPLRIRKTAGYVSIASEECEQEGAARKDWQPISSH